MLVFSSYSLFSYPFIDKKKSINLAFKQEKHDTTSKLLFTSLTLPSMNSELQDSINWMKAHAYISDRQPFFIIRVWSNFFSDIFSVKSWMIATKNLGGRNKRQCPIYKIDLFIKAQTEASF